MTAQPEKPGGEAGEAQAAAEPASGNATAGGAPASGNEPVPAPRPQRSARLIFTQSVLALQAFAALFATLLVSGLARAGTLTVSQGAVWGGGLALIVLLGYAAGKQKERWGVWLGWALQVPLIAAGLIDPAIAIIGVMFLALWITALRLGGRIDRERAERLAQEDA